jgi:hypothetical protein
MAIKSMVTCTSKCGTRRGGDRRRPSTPRHRHLRAIMCTGGKGGATTPFLCTAIRTPWREQQQHPRLPRLRQLRTRQRTTNRPLHQHQQQQQAINLHTSSGGRMRTAAAAPPIPTPTHEPRGISASLTGTRRRSSARSHHPTATISDTPTATTTMATIMVVQSSPRTQQIRETLARDPCPWTTRARMRAPCNCPTVRTRAWRPSTRCRSRQLRRRPVMRLERASGALQACMPGAMRASTATRRAPERLSTEACNMCVCVCVHKHVCKSA